MSGRENWRAHKVSGDGFTDTAQVEGMGVVAAPPQESGMFAGKYRSSMIKTHYTVLGVPPSSNREYIREAYITLALRHHPDPPVYGDKAKFQEIAAAYDCLKNPITRQEYDRQLAFKIKKCSRCSGNGEITVLRTSKPTEKKLCTKCAGTGQEE